ncbi:hypothetical protein, partial [Acinetobacter oleivorans]|uniref:hypothetical protein n=1 Tax=Acinetobacter oleivorans TaxID=1148157 RepID=UPI001C0862DC
DVSEKIDYIFSLQDKKLNKLQKDRFAKLILKNHEATYKDLKLLIPISNCDYWSKKYFESKKYINLIKDEKSGDFIMITYDTPKSKIALLGSGYFVFAVLGLSPYIFSAQLFPFIKAQNEAFSTLLLIVIVLLAVLSICIALLCMTRAGREYSASQFVLNFYKYGVHS